MKHSFFREIPSMGMFTEEWLPSMDISETQKNFIVKAELPGLDTKDVSINLSGGLLTKVAAVVVYRKALITQDLGHPRLSLN